MPGGWAQETVVGRPEDLVDAAIADGTGRLARIVEPTASAFVLGSTQAEPEGPTGHPIARRRSGGGGVLLGPDDPVWVDLIVPRGDSLWNDDVGAAAVPIGALWAAALARLDIEAEVHRGALVTTPWSRQLCFAGLGPGELTVDGRKVLGVAQRRTRAGACFQCALSLSPPGRSSVLAAGVPDEDVDAATMFLESFAGGVAASRRAVIEALGVVLTT